MSVGTTLTRREMLLLALMSSENRAAAALARTYPGGRAAFIRTMNRKARQLGMSQSRFHDATGLNPLNVASADDLAKMVQAAYRYPLIRQFVITSYSIHYTKLYDGIGATALTAVKLISEINSGRADGESNRSRQEFGANRTVMGFSRAEYRL